MKSTRKILLASLLLSGLQFGLTSCVTDAYVGVDTGYYYGPHYRDPWFRHGPWVDNHYYYRDRPRGGSRTDVYISPPAPPRLPSPPGIRLP